MKSYSNGRWVTDTVLGADELVSTKNLARTSGEGLWVLLLLQRRSHGHREAKTSVPGHTASKQRGWHLKPSPPKFLTSLKGEETAKLKFEEAKG